MTDWSFESTELDAMEKASLPRIVFTRVAPVLATMTFSALVALRFAEGLTGSPAPMERPQAPQAAHVAKPAAEAMVPAPATPLRAAAQAQGAVPAPAQAPAQVAPAQVASAKVRSTSPYGELFDPDYAVLGLADARPVGLDSSLFSADPMYKPAPEATTQVAQAAPRVDSAAPRVDSAAPRVDNAAPLAAPQKSAADLGLRVAEEETVVAPTPPTRPADLSRLAKVEDEAVKPGPAPERAKDQPQHIAPRVAARRLRADPQAQIQAQNDPRGFFEKLFGAEDQQKGPQLAYAAPEGGGALKLSRGVFAAARPAEGVAVYNIRAHTVTLPSGEQLEAHSGLGHLFDNPEGVHVRMRGATPPATYKLSLRESLFHGVQALRLTPIDSNVHGRNGLLAHTFMLGPRGDSNGCVSFRNYRAFLQAYQNGEIRHLRVVSGG
ncbi:Protein of unknown function [Rhodoblastus acidophilus]|uniref:Tlde1 domain-containing protein n=1 Tax=Rhodoblastus acidophilus TaxID=1074 RepID=A0A212Q9Q2_RHOAC|nr:tlde1 domain-containing protein [Rhodoblastus acidophilus]SNB56135.1 Protein of unknown function [Rhodoblastus acidophilus]